jgi:hypothetical protein
MTLFTVIVLVWALIGSAVTLPLALLADTITFCRWRLTKLAWDGLPQLLWAIFRYVRNPKGGMLDDGDFEFDEATIDFAACPGCVPGHGERR